METYIDFSAIMQIAVFMVGFTQLLKQFFEIKHKKLKIVLTIAVGLAGGIIIHFAPSWVFTTLLGVSVGVVFYDWILKSLEKVFKKEEQ